MEPTPFSSVKKGTLLIATPEITSGLFFRSVILVCESTSAGSFGLILNKPFDFDLPEELIDVSDCENKKIHLRITGAAQPNQLMLLHNSHQADQTLEICQGVFLGGTFEFLQEASQNKEGPSILLCFGYVGWGPNQLEEDLMSGAWITLDANSKHVFETPIEKLWEVCLKQKGGKFASLASIPEDLSLN